ncbi:Vacuolar protein sorting-associated protein 13A [Ceratobasidium sp. 428]|nr:Vacuolar protein sorting-associated protein 13A [Ceratobasidium sp. 428]
MTTTQWVLEGTDPNAFYELRGRKFGSGDEGAPLLCHPLCADQGRHAHIDYCRDTGNCSGPEQQHIRERMHPNANKPKDWITHRLKWAQSGFKDPYSRDQQVDFAKCDVLCPGSEHEAKDNLPAHPSYCNLPIFHAPHPRPSTRGSNSYVSRDGHSFDCPDPSRMNQAYHVYVNLTFYSGSSIEMNPLPSVFVIDSSGSMCSGDRQPLANTPISARLRSTCNNRYDAVLSALHGFWHSREPAQSGSRARQDAYSVVTFDYTPVTRVSNDFTSTTDQLIGQLIPQRGCGGTDFNAALAHAQALIWANWSSDRRVL